MSRPRNCREGADVALGGDAVVIKIRELDLEIEVTPVTVVLRHANVRREAVYESTFHLVSRRIYDKLLEYVEDDE